jgi:hypothetical protein
MSRLIRAGAIPMLPEVQLASLIPAQPDPRYVLIATVGANHFLHALDEAPVPAGAFLLAEGAWTWPQMKAWVTATQWSRIAEATWDETVDGVVVRRRGRIANRPAGAILIETDLPPHRFAGEAFP